MTWPAPIQAEFDHLRAYLRSVEKHVGGKPKAILLISAHWEEEVVTLNVGPAPGMLFDYYGFPDHTYHLSYPAPGAPDLGARVQALLEGAGIAVKVDRERGYDHGVFVPLMQMFPDADVPILQMSLRADMHAKFHIRLGQVLRVLRDEGVLIVGSGNSFHNLAALRGPNAAADEAAGSFDKWLRTAAYNDAHHRDEYLEIWATAPGARLCHPREEHLMPLMVVAGAAFDDPCTRDYSGRMMGKPISGFQFG
ncbi:DODA-type extradiol aromatic ring-opening family dioxygenase [Zavarzinia sp. CC-PAN008]|uniref:DODA-type extradiol aromatic ring-opening family dioxygenase n=1 Tax=Zavarzinia sp. CC-PAN008 TaxID=3243332 RepID=UPI003F7492FE